MSERSSFITEYVYCRKCFAALKEILLVEDSKHLVARAIGDLPIIAGKLGDSAPHLEWRALLEAFSLAQSQGKQLLCHKLRIAVVEDSGCTTTYIIHPEGIELQPGFVYRWDTTRPEEDE